MPAWFRACVARSNLSRTFATARSMRSKISGLMPTVWAVQRSTLDCGRLEAGGMSVIITTSHRDRRSRLRAPIRRKAPRRFPKLAFHDRKAAAGGEFENQAGDVLGGRILSHEEQRLT